MLKKELRQILRRAIQAVDPAVLHERSVRACNLLCQQREFQRAEIIMVFLSMPGEVDTTTLVLQAWEASKRVLAPKIIWEQRRMLPIEINSLTDDVSRSPMGLREPAKGAPIPVADIDLVIVPGLGFDAHGNRLGRGRGFYDRFLGHRDFRGVACGISLAEQVVESIPAGPHDRPVHLLATDERVRRFTS